MKFKIITAILCCIYVTSLYSLKDGEKFIYDIKYGVVTAGEAVLHLQKSQFNNRDAWSIVVTAETNSFFDTMYKVRDKIESISSFNDFYSYKFSKNMEEGKYRQRRIQQNYIDQSRAVYSSFNFKSGVFVDKTIPIPEECYDLMSAFYKFRTMDFEVGDKVNMNVSSDGKNYIAVISVLKKEKIDTVLGKKNCYVISPGLQGDAIFKQTGSINIWLTDDDEKIPVLLQSKVVFGSFKAVLKSVKNTK